jgi:hypothetical protein
VVGMLPSPISLRRPRWLHLKAHFALPPFLTKRNPPPSSILPSLAFFIWTAVSRLRALMFDPLDRFSPPTDTRAAMDGAAMRRRCFNSLALYGMCAMRSNAMGRGLGSFNWHQRVKSRNAILVFTKK